LSLARAFDLPRRGRVALVNMMPTRAKGSSEQDARARAAATRAALDGESLPELAARDEARLLVQSPHRLFFYWNFARDPRIALRRALGELAVRFELGARLVALEDDAPGEPISTHGREVWFDAKPHRAYRAEVGFHAEGLPFVRVLASNVARTPADTISALTDDDAAFQIGAADLSRLPTIPFSGETEPSVASKPNVGERLAKTATLVAPVSSFALTRFAPSSFVLGVAAPKRQD
jgi:hypothetical protein